MRCSLLLFLWLCAGAAFSQGNGFSFSYTGPSQIIVGPDCVEPLEWGHPNTPTASSNIPGGVIVSFEIYSISGGYDIGDLVGGGTTVTVFYQALDNFGNTALFGFTITFIDIIPPYFDPLSLPQNMTVNCTGNFPIADVEAHDNCEEQDIVLTVTFTESNNAAPCTGGTITRTWVADDDLGNQATFIQTITVLPDNTPPVIANNLVNGSAPCSTAMAQYTTWLNAQRAAFSATDSGCGVMTLSDNAPSPAIITSFCGDIVVTFTAKDNCNNISTVDKTFTITNSVPPVITMEASNASGNCSQANIQQVFSMWIGSHGGATATDDCSSVQWSTFPPSPSLDDTCGVPFTILFIAGDGCGNTDTTSATFTLTDETPPVITDEPVNRILSCSSMTIDSLLMDWLMTFGQTQAMDLCTDEDNLVAGYRVSGTELTLEGVLEAWQDSLDAGCHDNVIIGGVGLNNVLAYIPVEFTYDDACGNEAGEIGYFGLTDNGRPQFVTVPVDTSFVCSQNEDWEAVFLTWYNTAGGATYMDLCSEVTVNASITADSAIQYLTAALDTACQAGVEVSIQFTLVDDCGNESTIMPTAIFSLSDTVAPVITTPAQDYIASCATGSQEQLNNWLDTLAGAEASDGCGSIEWIFTWMDTAGQTVNGVPLAGPYPEVNHLDCAGGLEVIFMATDICDNTVSDTAVFSLIDTLPPVIIIEEDSIHLTCGDTISVDTPGVTDGCGGEITLVFEDSAGIDSCLGQPEIITRTWTATDACGNSSTAQVFIFRIDSIAPTFELPSDTVEFCSVDTLELINLQDNCDPEPVSSFTDVITGPACQQSLERTWMVSDACGNTATAVQIFDLSDETPPIILNTPGHFVYTCADGNVQDAYEFWLNNVGVIDACSDVSHFIAVPGSYIAEDTSTWPGTPMQDSVFLVCGVDVVIEGDVVAFDLCGNVTVEEISFTVNDTIGPIFTNCQSVIIVEPDTSTCTGMVHLEIPAVDEICYPDSVTMVLVIDGGDTIRLDSVTAIDTIMEVGIHTAIWIATDCEGNSNLCETTIEIIDENAVTLTCPSDTLLFVSDTTCNESLWVFPPVTTSGACAKGVVELRMEIIGDAIPDSMVFASASDSVLVSFRAGIHQVLLIARDSTGDIDTCRYVVELRDTIAPVILCTADTLILHPSGLEEIDLSTTSLVSSANDNCGIDSIIYSPATINCDSAGQEVSVTIIAFDAAGNSDTCVASLFVTTQELMPEWSMGLCDDTLRLFANLPPGPVSGYIFNWSGPNGFASNDENPVIPGADSTFSGIYTLMIQSDSGCVASGSVEVMIQSLIAPVISIDDDTICVGQLLVLNTQTYTGVVSYQWYQVAPAGDTIVSNTEVPSFDFIPSAPGTYTFFAVVTQDTCISAPSPDINVFVIPAPVAIIGEISMPLCTYDTLFLSPDVVIDSLIYTWTGPGGFMSNDAIPPGIAVSEIDSPFVFYLTVANAFCSSPADSIVIDIQPLPETPVIDGDTLICEGGSFTLQASTVADEYVWIDPASNTTVTNVDSIVVNDAQTQQSGAWRVITSVNGCVSDTSDAFIVQIDSSISIEIIAPVVSCQGDSIQLSVTPIYDGNYLWTGPGGFTSDQPSPMTVAAEGTYTVSLLTQTGCEATDSIDVTVDALPLILSIETDADSCVDGTGDIRLWAITDPVSDGGFSFMWSGPGGFMSQDSSPVIADFSSALNGEYILTIVNGSCTTEVASILVDVTDSPAAPLITGENVYCFGDTIVLGIESPVDGGLYAWTSSDTNVVLPSPGTLVIPDADQGFTGIYNVNVTIDGCGSPSSNIAIQVRPALTVPVVNAPMLVCEGESLNLSSNAPAGADVQWFGPNGFSSTEAAPFISPVMPIHAGAYYLVYTFNGCPSDTSARVEVAVQSTLAVPMLTTDITALCIDAPVPVMLCVDAATVTPGGTYTWYLNSTDVIAGPSTDTCVVIQGEILEGGQNHITVITSLQGCLSDTSTALIIQGDEFPGVMADAGMDMQYCPDEIIVLDAAAPTPGTGIWTTGSPLVLFEDVNNPVTSVAALPPGVYQLQWTLSFATCIDYSTDEVTITVVPSPLALPDTFNVAFGQTAEFFALGNDSLFGIPFTLEIVMGTQRGNVLHAGNGIFRYTPNIGFVGTDVMRYRICSTDCPEECSEATIVLRVGNEDDCFIPTLFTPNDDGVNDVLIIPCLETERFPDNKIIIFNEWGDAVYTSSPYLNDWDGRFSGDPLPVGTYFYIMDFGDGSEARRSFLIIER